MDISYNYIIDYEYMIGKKRVFAKKVNGGNKFLLDFCNVDSSIIFSSSSVYMIDSFYIGFSSYGVKSRILQHVRQSINGKHSNKKLQELIMNCINNNIKMPVTILSKNKKDEAILIREYSKTHNLCNISCNPNF